MSKDEEINKIEIKKDNSKEDVNLDTEVKPTHKELCLFSEGSNLLEGSAVNTSKNNEFEVATSSKTISSEPTRKERKDKNQEIKQMITTANQLFVKNDFNSCISILKNILTESPKNSNAYFMLGLVFEEMKDDIKAYNFYLIASQLMKTNYGLWEKLYDLSSRMNLLSDKLYFIQMLQRKRNTKDLVEEKLLLYKILKSKYKILETKIELFYFDGVDFNIFNKIRSETKHKAMTSKCALCLIRYFKKYPNKCGLEFLMDIIRLQYDTGYLYGTRNLIEKYFIGKVDLPRDIRIIYIICVLVNTDPPEIVESNSVHQNVDNLEFRESLFVANESIFDGMNYKDEIFDIYEDDTHISIPNDNISKTLNINTLLLDTSVYDKVSDIDVLIKDKYFWSDFQEIEHIKGLLEVLRNLKMENQYLKILNILEAKVDFMKEFIYISYGNFYYEKHDFDNSLFYYQKTLDVNPDNNAVKSKLYEIYKTMGNIDLANKFHTISSLINFVDDIRNDDKSRFMLSADKCNDNRDLYIKSRILFKENLEKYHIEVRPLIDDFLDNRFLFFKHKKYNIIGEEKRNEVQMEKKGLHMEEKNVDNMKNNENISKHDDDIIKYDDDISKKEERCLIINQSNHRLLSLHGLNTDEWSAVLLEYVISNIVMSKMKEASHLLKKSLDCAIFKKRTDIYLQFIFLTIKHAIFYNDLNLLTSCFKKAFSVFKDYGWANFYFYLLNFFPDYIIKNSFGNLIRNIRRIFKRNGLFISGKEKSSSSVYRSLDLNLLLSSFFIKNIANKSYKIINSIILNDNLKDKMTYFIILIITYKSRRNETKNEMLKNGLDGLKNLLDKCNKEDFCNLSYNIGVAYHMLGYVGFAEKHYVEAMKSKNIELRRMARLSLMIVYKNSNLHLLKKLYDEDETT